MKFRFPIVIIDEDFRSENASGLSIRALAAAIEKEGLEVLGTTSYGDLSQFAQQQSRASAFILSIDDEEFTPGPELDPAILKVRAFIEEIRFKNAEIGQLLDHSGPVAASERNAARIFNADHCFFVTNGTSTSNKMVWHANVAPDDIVVVDRNCHVSILHAITMTGAIPVFLTPTRNNLGIIGPIGLDSPKRENIRHKIEANPSAREAEH